MGTEMDKKKKKEKSLDWPAGENPEPYDPKIWIKTEEGGRKKDGVWRFEDGKRFEELSTTAPANELISRHLFPFECSPLAGLYPSWQTGTSYLPWSLGGNKTAG